jgi:coproporphyrinogen III oxidase
MRARFEKVIRAAQDSICAAISEIDGTPFHQDAWVREAGGGGITRVLQVRPGAQATGVQRCEQTPHVL